LAVQNYLKKEKDCVSEGMAQGRTTVFSSQDGGKGGDEKGKECTPRSGSTLGGERELGKYVDRSS